MKKNSISFLLVLHLCLLLSSQAAPPLSPIWFQHIEKPLSIPPGKGEKFAADLRKMLLASKTAEEITAAFPDDPNPRIIFIALGDGEWPERIAMNTGSTFRQALKNTLITLQQREKKYTGLIQQQQKILEEQDAADRPPLSASWKQKLKNPNQWNCLRITIVQKSRQYENFSISLSKILLSNLNGIAFPRSAGFAFPPEQMTGRYLLTPDHFFDSNQIGNILSESENFQSMSTWMQLTTSAPPFPVILFDCASFYADEKTSVRLFRSHSVPDVRLTPQLLLDKASACGQKMLPLIHRNGKLSSPFPEWFSSIPNGEHPAVLGELSIAFSRLHAATGNKEFASAAAKINRGLAGHLKKYRIADHLHRCLIEKEILENPDDPQDPRKIANTRTNAMAALAFLEFTRCTGDRELMETAGLLIRHLINVQQNSGGFRPIFIYPAMNIPAENYFSEADRLETAAVAALAMLRYKELTDNLPELSLQQRIFRSRNLIYGKYQQNSVQNSFSFSPWIMEFLTAVNAGNLKPLQLLVGKMAIAANLHLENDPILPDLFGSVRDTACMTVSAERTWMTASAAENLWKNGEKEQAELILSDSWPQLMFQMQAVMDRATASSLPQPRRYHGYFRDNLDTFSFNLDGQICQMLSLLTVRRTLLTMNRQNLAPTPDAEARRRRNWDKISVSPFLLTDDLIITRARSENDVRRLSGNIRGTSTTTRIQPHGGKIMGTSKNPTGAVLRSPDSAQRKQLR